MTVCSQILGNIPTEILNLWTPYSEIIYIYTPRRYWNVHQNDRIGKEGSAEVRTICLAGLIFCRMWIFPGVDLPLPVPHEQDWEANADTARQIRNVEQNS